MPSKYYFEIWNSANTQRQHVIKDGVVISGQVVDELNGVHTIELTVDRRDDCWSFVVHGKILKLINSQPTPFTAKSFRVTKAIDSRDGDNKLLGMVKAEHIKYDLGDQIHNASEEIIQQTPALHMAKILAGSGFTVGTVTPAGLVTIAYNYNSRLFDLTQLQEQTGYDIIVNEDLSVDLATRGETTKASIVYKKNLLSISRTLDRLTGNKMYGVGGEGNLKQVMTIAEATHRITVIASLTVTLDSRKVVSSNDSFNGMYVEIPDGTFIQITDSIKQMSGNDQLVLASVAGLAVGDPLIVRTSNASTARLEYIPDQASISAYSRTVESVFRDESVQEIRNLIGPNASSSFEGTYTSGLCEGWTEVGDPTTTENADTAFIKYGAKSQKVEVVAISAPSSAPTAATGIAGILTGAYQYKITWKSVDGETTVSSASGTVNPSSQTVDVGRNNTPPAHVIYWSIYRTLDGGSTFFWVADVAIGTTSYNDNVADALLTVSEPAQNKACGGQGIERTFTAVTDKEYAAACWVFVASGQVRFELHTGTSFYPDLGLASAKRATPVRAQTTLWTITIQGLIATGTAGKVRVVAHEGPAVFYVDAAMAVKSAYIPAEDVFVPDNSATDPLWYKTYDELQLSKDPKVTYDVNGLDLFEYDPGGYPDDEIETGDTIKVIDDDLGITTSLRCMKKSFNPLTPWDTANMEFTNVPEKITKLIRSVIRRVDDVGKTTGYKGVKAFHQARREGATSASAIMEFSELKE